MTTPDMDVIKEIPGYKVILKAVLKSQIQQLVEQLAAHTEEESIILTASVADGTLGHLGSDSGKSFLEDHEDVKSQFLGFCLKWHHKRQQEKERDEAICKAAENTPLVHYMPTRSPRHISPRFPGPRGQMFQSAGMRHQPYPTACPLRAYFKPKALPLMTGVTSDNQVIKVEPDNDEDASNNSDLNSQSVPNSSRPSSPSQAPSPVKNEISEKDEDAQSESSISTIPNETLPEGLSSDSDFSNLISGGQSKSVQQTPSVSDIDPDFNIKLEAINESEMDLEITGVEPGRHMVSQANRTPDVSMGMNFDPSGATGSPADVTAAQQGYNGIPSRIFLKPGKYRCSLCEKCFLGRSDLERHIRVHTGEKPFKCEFCGYSSTQKVNLKKHVFNAHGVVVSQK